MELLGHVKTWSGDAAMAAAQLRLSSSKSGDEWGQVHQDVELEVEEAETVSLLDQIAARQGTPCDEEFTRQFRAMSREDRHSTVAKAAGLLIRL